MFKKLELSKPSQATINRLTEIEFVMAIDTIASGLGREHVDNAVTLLCKATGTNVSQIMIAYNNLKKMNKKPQKFELVLMYRFKGFSLKEIKNITRITPNTQTKWVSQYIYDDEPDLIPQLSMPYLHDELRKFLKSYNEKMGKASVLTLKALQYTNYEG